MSGASLVKGHDRDARRECIDKVVKLGGFSPRSAVPQFCQGYGTDADFRRPVLDQLIAEPEEFRYHSINELVDELDVIAGG